MAGRKLVRDFFLTRQPLFVQLASRQGSSAGQRSVTVGGYLGNRRFSVFNEFSKNVKGEAKSPEFQQSVKELKEKAEDLKNRTKQTTEQLYKHVDGVWSEAEATAKKVSSNIKEKISAAKEEVKESFNIGKQESSGSSQCSGTSAQHEGDLKSEGRTSSGEEKHKQSDTAGTAESLFEKFKSGLSSPKVSLAFQKLKETKVSDLAKKGYDIVKDEISGNPSKKRHLEYAPPSWAATTSEKSDRTDVVIVPKKQSYWGKRWDGLKDKMRDHPLFKRISIFSEPAVIKSQEIAEDVRERWETSDSPIVQKIQDINESLSQETDAAAARKEIHRRDPSFSLPDFVAEVQEAIKPVLTAYKKGDTETLKKYCTSEVVERCKAEHTAYKSHDIFFDNKILHISEVEVREMKMMGTSPIIIVAFQTQQIYCVRDRQGVVKEGGKDTIHTVYYAWAMQQIDPEELGDGAIYPIWKLREMQEMGIQALI